MFIIWFCSIVGLSLLILVAYQISLGNIVDGSQIAASISLLVFSLVAWSQTRSTDQTPSTDDRTTFLSASQVEIPQTPPPIESPSSGDAMTFQPITIPHLAAAGRHENGMRIVGPNDPIPEEVCCAICGRNMLQTRNDFGSVLVCPHPDCGQWYHKNHFYDTANGKCISPPCRRRS
jgi:hypothetical protein